jgi:uncharacterized membrane protein YdbT with pleckstrin-like domain
MPNILKRYHFREQHEGEEVIRVIHRHWFNLLSHLFSIVAFAFVIATSFLILPVIFPETLDPNNYRAFSFVQNTLLMFVWIYSFLIWIDYYFDVWIITTERVINIEQKGLFVREMSELSLSRVQDATTEVRGVIPTIFNYGDVHIQTAGETERFIFRQVGDPYRVKDLVMQLSRERGRHDLRNAVETIKDQA